ATLDHGGGQRGNADERGRDAEPDALIIRRRHRALEVDALGSAAGSAARVVEAEHIGVVAVHGDAVLLIVLAVAAVGGASDDLVFAQLDFPVALLRIL